jgi:hypothetical protein
MSRTSYTPGPWKHEKMRLPPKEKDRRCGFVVNGPDDGSASLPIRICDMRIPDGLAGFEEGEANARLISSAPELLEALRPFAPLEIALWSETGLKVWTEEGGEQKIPDELRFLIPAIHAARAAIAKAEGETYEQ